MRINRRIAIDKRYSNEVIEIQKVDDFILYYNSIKDSDNFIKFPENVSLFIESKIKSNSTESHKSFIRTISKMIDSPRFKTVKEYWTLRGYSIKEANLKVSELQTYFSNKFVKKRKDSPEQYIGILPNQAEYWQKQGYSKEEAILKVKERQSTFSVQRCIEKHGKENGQKIFKDRQSTWQNSRVKSEGITWNYSDQSLSTEMYVKRYGKEWIIAKNKHLLERGSNSKLINSNKVLYNLKYNKKDIIEHLMSCKFNEVCFHAINTSFNYVLDMNHLQIKSEWMKYHDIDYKSTPYGNCYWKKDKFYKSNAEFKIGEYLNSVNLDFQVNIKYPNSNRFTDFYIKDLDLYIEYMGMSTSLYDDKIKQMDKSPYKIIWSNNINQIINAIDEKIYKHNRSK